MKALLTAMTLVLTLSSAALAGQGSTELVKVCSVVQTYSGSGIYNVNVDLISSEGRQIFSKTIIFSLTQADAIKVLSTQACR